MRLPHEPFALERFFARWEFTAELLLCSSDMQSLPQRELLALADAESRALWDELTLGYTESAGHPLLRAAIAATVPGATAADVLTFTGAEEAIFASVQAVVGPGDHAIVTWPAYQSLASVAEAAGAAVTRLALDPARGWALDLEALRAAVRPNTNLIMINFPHNPTGALLDAASYHEVIQIAAEANATLFSDEVYRLLEYNQADRLPAAASVSERAISLGVMSKAYGLAGLRVGWIVTRDAALRARIAAHKDYLSICGSAPSEILALIGLRAEAELLRRNHALLRSNLAQLDAFFARNAERVGWVRPRAGSVAFPELRLGRPVAELADALVQATGVLIAPAGLFGLDGNYFRLGFGRANLPQALERFEGWLRAQ